MKPPDQSATDADLERLKIAKQLARAWQERGDRKRLIRLCRATGTPLPRQRKYRERYLEAGVAEMRRTGQSVGPEFFAEYKRKLRSEAAQKRTPARQAQALANLAKMRAALKQKGYPMTPKKRAACCANLAQWRHAQSQEKARLAAGLQQALPAPSARAQGAHGQMLEKVQGRIQRAWESLRRGGRQEGRRVMAVLAQAAARLAPPSLPEMLELANRLMGALAGGRRLLARKDRLNGRLCRLLEALAERRYGKYTRLHTLPSSNLPRRPGQGEGPPPGGPGQPMASPGGRDPETPSGRGARAPSGPDLPDQFEDFQALVDRAFFAPEPAPPPEGDLRPLLHLIGRTLWERLHAFEEFVKGKMQELGRELKALGKTRKGADLAKRGRRIVRVLAAEGGRQYLASFAHDCRQRLATLMTLRYGADPAIEGFSAVPYGCLA